MWRAPRWSGAGAWVVAACTRDAWVRRGAAPAWKRARCGGGAMGERGGRVRRGGRGKATGAEDEAALGYVGKEERINDERRKETQADPF